MKLNKKIIFLMSIPVLVYFSINCYAFYRSSDSYLETFGGSDYEKFNSISKTSDGGFIVAGQISSKDIGYAVKGGSDGLLIKYNSKGIQEWASLYGGSYGDEFKSVIETSDGGFVAVGSRNTKESGSGISDAVIVKFDETGNVLWNRTITGNDNDYFKSVIETTDGGFVVVGQSYSTNAGFTNAGNTDGIIVKYSANGTREWLKNYGSTYADYFEKVIETSEGDLVAIGTSGKAIIVRYTSNGVVKWVNKNETMAGRSYNSVIEASNGDLIVAGYTNPSDTEIENKGKNDAMLISFNSNGEKNWIKNFGGSENDSFTSIINTIDNGFVAVGSSLSSDAGFEAKGNQDAIMIKYNNKGEQLWIKSFGGSKIDCFYSVIELSENNFVACGYSYSTDTEFENKGSADGIILMLNSVYIEINNAIEKVETTLLETDLLYARSLVNILPEGEFKKECQSRLNNLNVSSKIKPKNVTANFDLYIKSENMLKLSIDTNSITFEDFSGLNDLENLNAVNLTVNSSLPYKINAYLATEIKNSNGTNIMDKNLLNIRVNGQSNYNAFTDIATPIILLDDQEAGNDISHGIDLMLKGDLAYKKDIYKTTIKFEVEQK